MLPVESSGKRRGGKRLLRIRQGDGAPSVARDRFRRRTEMTAAPAAGSGLTAVHENTVRPAAPSPMRDEPKTAYRRARASARLARSETPDSWGTAAMPEEHWHSARKARVPEAGSLLAETRSVPTRHAMPGRTDRATSRHRSTDGTVGAGWEPAGRRQLSRGAPSSS